MNGNFDACLARVLVYEGLYSNNPNDPGGATMRGVTQAVYDRYRANRGQPKTSVRGITDGELKAIYRNQYWDTIHADALAAGVDLALFDVSVNSGPGRANGWRSLVKGEAGADIDRICDRRLSFLQALRTWQYFGKGWAKRVADVRARAHAMASGVASLPKKADEARKSASTKAKAATGSAATSVGSGGYASVNFDWIVLAIGVVTFAAAAYFIWRSMQEGETVQAYEAASNETPVKVEA